MTTIENGKSSADNLKEIAWVQQQTKEELNTLTNNVESNFYEKNADGTVTYKMDLVKQYLNSIKGKNWNELVSKNSSAWIMAVQIALESMWYDVGKVDGLLWKVTSEAVRKFQTDKGLKVDGAPGPDTIAKILQSLEGGNGKVEETDDQKLEKVKAKQNAKVEKGGQVKAEELVEGVGEWVNVSLKEGQEIKTDELGEIKVVVVVKVWDKVKEIEVVVKIVEKEELDKEKIDQVKAKELVEVEIWGWLDPRDLVENLPDDAWVGFKEWQDIWEKIHKEWEYKIIVVVKIWNEVRELEVVVRVVKKKAEKPDDKPDGNTDENPDDKSDENPDDKSDENPDDKSDENPDDKSDENPDENPDDVEKYRDLKYWKLNCYRVENLRNGSKLIIKSRDELMKFGPNLYDKYDDNYFRYHSLALYYYQRTNTADEGLDITSVTRIPWPMFWVDVKYKDLTKPGAIWGAMMWAVECLFVEINKNEENNVNWRNESPMLI